jgi:hypothetical protein
MAKVVAKKKILYGILQEQVEKTANFRKAEFDFRKKEIDRKEFFEYDERSSKERTFGKKKMNSMPETYEYPASSTNSEKVVFFEFP